MPQISEMFNALGMEPDEALSKQVNVIAMMAYAEARKAAWVQFASATLATYNIGPSKEAAQIATEQAVLVADGLAKAYDDRFMPGLESESGDR